MQWRLVGLHLTQKKLQHFDPWKSFQSLSILAWSEKWPFCRSFWASLSSAFRSHLFHSPSLEKTKGLLLKGHRKIGVQLPTAKSIWAIRLQGTERPSPSTFITFIFGRRFILVAQVTALTLGACSPGCRTAEGSEQGTKLFGIAYVVLEGCLHSSPSLLASEACMLWAIMTWLYGPSP